MDLLDEFEPPSEDLEDDGITVSQAFKRLKDGALNLPPFEQRKLFQGACAARSSPPATKRSGGPFASPAEDPRHLLGKVIPIPDSRLPIQIKKGW